MPAPPKRHTIFAQIAKKLAADETLLQLLRESYNDPKKTKFEEELAAMIPSDAAPFDGDIYGDFASYCGCVNLMGV